MAGVAVSGLTFGDAPNLLQTALAESQANRRMIRILMIGDWFRRAVLNDDS